MEIKFIEQNDRLDIVFIGHLDNAATPEAELALKPVYECNCDILVDCGELSYISSKGLRLLINLYKDVRDKGHKAFITKMNKNVREVLYIGGVLTLFQEVE